MATMVRSHIHGFPRIGPRRELKMATEGYWAGKISADQLIEAGKSIRKQNWEAIKAAGVDIIPSNDFSFYDQVLDTVCLLGAVPLRYGHKEGPVELDTYFAMARGRQVQGVDVTAMDMTKWFDTNLHYIVPELDENTNFALSSDKPFAEHAEAQALGFQTAPVIIGPISFLLLAKASSEAAPDFEPLSLLDKVLPVYEKILQRLGGQGADWVQFDEPALAEDRSVHELRALQSAYAHLGSTQGRPKMFVNTYFDHIGEAYSVLKDLPVEGLGLDFVAGAQNEEFIQLHGAPKGKTLFAGVVDGRNVWINDLGASLKLVERLTSLFEDVVVCSSSSLVHVPIDVALEENLDPEVRPWLAFARQKVDEIVALTKALNEGGHSGTELFTENRLVLEQRKSSSKTSNPQVRSRLDKLGHSADKRAGDYGVRRQAQKELLNLPVFPTTTIGSYPQTREIREARAKLRKGEITEQQYTEQMHQEIERVVRFQEKAGLDVVVHGEPERNDMVQYFAEQLDGYLFTQNAWVQSYGSRYVRPPIIFGDIHRPKPMTVDWIRFAQMLTDKPVKGMLTGPVTMLMWSFVRDDQPLSKTCEQLALAIRDEVGDLEAAGFRVIQVDEPAIREGMPLRQERTEEYLDWAVKCFRLSTSGVANETQIQTHMCYSDFGDIISAMDAMDADVALIEAARSNMELLEDFRASGYNNEIGPGVYDIHSPRVPSVAEMVEKLRAAAKVIDPHKIWVNPDCGLKTRAWPETEASLQNMVAAAEELRQEFAAKQ
ncbi:MAG: 5-methyltetrahydropteroyltriglutamate--homocysteine S-methyltransferase [Actinomycetota bacterium]